MIFAAFLLAAALACGAAVWAYRAEIECRRLRGERNLQLAREDMLLLRLAARTPAQAAALEAVSSGSPVERAVATAAVRYLYDDTGLIREAVPVGED